MKSWTVPFAVALGGIALLGGVAYYLQRSKSELDWSVSEAFKTGGWLSGFTSSNPKGIVTEGSPEDFTVNGTFEPTAAQVLRSQPKEI